MNTRLIRALLVSLLVAGCGGGGGGGAAPPPASPPPPPPPPPPGPTDPAIALARPISAALLCGNGMARRAASVSTDQFVAAGSAIGITHWHAVDEAVWTAAPDSPETIVRTGAVLTTHLDDDCWPDLVFTTGTTAAAQLALYENVYDAGLPGRAFSQRLLSVTAATNPIAGLGAADLDGDYRQDLVLGNALAGSMQIWRADGAGGFSPLQTLAMARSTFGFAFGDYSGDGWLDAYAAHWDLSPPPADAAALLRNQGGAGTAGSLAGADAAAGTTPPAVPHDFELAPAFVDLEDDGDADLLIAADFATSRVLVGDGAAGFAVLLDGAALGDENAAGQAVRDFDNDGRWDWFVASVHEPVPDDGRPWPFGTAGNRLHWGVATSPFLGAADPAAGIADAEWPWGVCAEDFDNDGLTDLFVENGIGLPDAVMASLAGDPFVEQINASLGDKKFLRPRLFMNQGNRTFVESSTAWGLTGTTNGRGVACFDYDRDGDIDIATAQNSGPATLLENRHSGAGGGHFAAVRLVSTAPNTAAIGARVTIEAGGATQRRVVEANGSFQGQHGPELHFGLADAVTIDRITVRWPDGASTTYDDVPADRFLTLLDPAMLPYADPARQVRIADAIADALAHLANPGNVDDDVLLGLTWMQRIHGISLPYSPADELIARAADAQGSGEAARARQLRSWRRLFDASYTISAEDHAGLVGFDAVTFSGVYCHQTGLALDDAAIQAFRDYAAGGAQGGYDTTHALLALLWTIDNDCALPPSWDATLLAQVVADVYAIAAAGGSTTVTDLRVEAMAMLAAAGRHDLIQAAWVDQVLGAQMAGGGWRAAPGDVDPTDHTTGLALWLLLQLAEERRVVSGFVAQPWGP